MLDLTPEGPLVRPFWYGVRRKRLRIEEPIAFAHARPRNRRTDWNVRATGLYAPGGLFDFAGFQVISCPTALGIVEFAVSRPDAPLVLHYFDSLQRPKPAAT